MSHNCPAAKLEANQPIATHFCTFERINCPFEAGGASSVLELLKVPRGDRCPTPGTLRSLHPFGLGNVVKLKHSKLLVSS